MTNSTEMRFCIEPLLKPGAFPHPTDELELLETHISWVVLTGSFAYKIKKPLSLGFLDFSTLEKRRHFCHEELRLNSRLAPGTYLEVVPITGTPEKPQVEGAGPPFEYAVKMRQFSQDGLLDVEVRRDRLSPAQIDEIAEQVAEFHQQIERAGPDSEYGSPENVQKPAVENFDETLELVTSEETRARLSRLREWTVERYAALRPLLEDRHQRGFIRECHGDLHLGNMAHTGQGLIIFDGIEFNANLRWTDVVNEVAFLFMDLEHHRRPDYAWRFLDRYLQKTGDYAGMQLLDYYLVYRAMVRAKVAAIRLAQAPQDCAQLRAEFSGFLKQAEGYARGRRPRLVLMHGLAAAGKTTVSQHLLERLGGVRLRSDVERKRLFGLEPEQSSGSKLNAGIYSAEASRKTFAHLCQSARRLLDCGLTVLVDATFLRAEARRPFVELAQRLGVDFTIVDVQTDPEVCRARLLERQGDASEADLKVLESQLESFEPLSESELSHTVVLDGSRPLPSELPQPLC